mmetsp:Transcript_6328/g.14383  ORF Transcript_6328/g.14383 Transcript_6328/m.14383 type:complete len:94 (+) Transcript_6328:170-451(+)
MYYPKPDAKPEDIARHNVLMRGAATAVSRVLDKEFRDWMDEYHHRASRLAQRDADALGSKWDDAVVGALTGTPLHHLNTTMRKLAERHDSQVL